MKQRSDRVQGAMVHENMNHGALPFFRRHIPIFERPKRYKKVSSYKNNFIREVIRK